MFSDCTASNEIAEEPMVGLKKLILGSALTSQRRFQSAVIACRLAFTLRSDSLEMKMWRKLKSARGRKGKVYTARRRLWDELGCVLLDVRLK